MVKWRNIYIKTVYGMHILVWGKFDTNMFLSIPLSIWLCKDWGYWFLYIWIDTTFELINKKFKGSVLSSKIVDKPRRVNSYITFNYSFSTLTTEIFFSSFNRANIVHILHIPQLVQLFNLKEAMAKITKLEVTIVYPKKKE